MDFFIKKSMARPGKGQIILKWFFGVFDFLQKTNKNKLTWGIIVVKSNSFVRFLEEIKDTKNHYEIIWPLEIAQVIRQHFVKLLIAETLIKY